MDHHASSMKMNPGNLMAPVDLHHALLFTVYLFHKNSLPRNSEIPEDSVGSIWVNVLFRE